LIKNRKEPEANIISAHKIMTHANYIDPALREQFLSRLQESTPGKRLATIYGTGRSYRPTSNEPIGKEIALARHDWELLCQFLRGQFIGVGADDIPKTAVRFKSKAVEGRLRRGSCMNDPAHEDALPSFG